jgi:hypothetical protein
LLDQIRSTLRFPRSGQFYLLNDSLTANEVTRLFDAAVTDQNSQFPAPGLQNVVHGPTSANSNIEFREIRGDAMEIQVEGVAVG